MVGMASPLQNREGAVSRAAPPGLRSGARGKDAGEWWRRLRREAIEPEATRAEGIRTLNGFGRPRVRLPAPG